MKLNKKGFMMAEVVVVSSVILIILTTLYISYNKIISLYETRLDYTRYARRPGASVCRNRRYTACARRTKDARAVTRSDSRTRSAASDDFRHRDA